MEKQIAQEGYKGWIAFTTVDNDKMIKFFYAVGGEAYMFDGESHRVWFMRDRENILMQKVGLIKKLLEKGEIRWAG
jgi:hypothetical protein